MNQQPVRLCAVGLFSFLCMGILMPALFKPSPWAFPLGADSPYQGEMSRSDRGDREGGWPQGQTDEEAF